MDKVCVSIFANDYDISLEVVKKYEFVELRLDEGKLTNEQITKVISAGKKIIATCRSGFINDEKRYNILLTAINSGTSFIDIEHDFDTEFGNELINSAIKSNVKIIRSYHNFKRTPEINDLRSMIASLKENCDIVKITCKVNRIEDIINLLELYNYEPAGKIISIGLGEMGKISRVAGLFLGAPFTYASLSSNVETAEGQLDFDTIMNILSGLGYE